MHTLTRTRYPSVLGESRRAAALKLKDTLALIDTDAPLESVRDLLSSDVVSSHGHSLAYVEWVLETAQLASGGGSAREFAKTFLERPFDYSKTKAGIAALMLEVWLTRRGQALFRKFVETVVDGQDTFLLVFEGPLSQTEFDRMKLQTEEFVQDYKLLVAAGQRNVENMVSDLTIFEVKAAAKLTRDSLPKTDPDPRPSPVRMEPRDDERKRELGLRPESRQDYERVLAEGGVSTAAFPVVFGQPVVRASRDGLSFADQSGVVWERNDVGQWLPRLDKPVQEAGGPPGLRKAPAGTAACETCAYFEPPMRGGVGVCSQFDVRVSPEKLCDVWDGRETGAESAMPAPTVRIVSSDPDPVDPPVLDGSPPYEVTEAGVTRSLCGSWALFEAPVAGGPSRTVIVAESSAWALDVPPEQVLRTVAEIVACYPDALPWHRDRCVEHALAEWARDEGAEIENQDECVAVVQADQDLLAERDMAVAEARTTPEKWVEARGLKGNKTRIGSGQGGVVYSFSGSPGRVLKVAKKASREGAAAKKLEGMNHPGLARVFGVATFGEEDYVARENVTPMEDSEVIQSALIQAIHNHTDGASSADEVYRAFLEKNTITGTGALNALGKAVEREKQASVSLIDAFLQARKRGVDLSTDLQLGQIGRIGSRIVFFDYGNALREAVGEEPEAKEKRPVKKDEEPKDEDPKVKEKKPAKEPEGPPAPPAPPPPPEPSDRMDDPEFYRDDLQSYYDVQILSGVSPKQAAQKTRQRFKVKELVVTPTGEVRSPGVVDRPKPPLPPMPAGSPAAPPAPIEQPDGAPDQASAGAAPASPPAKEAMAEVAPVVIAWAKRAGKSREEAERRWKKAGDLTTKNYPDVEPESEQWYQIKMGIFRRMMGIAAEAVLSPPETIDDAFHRWVRHADGDVEDFEEWLADNHPQFLPHLALWIPADLHEGTRASSATLTDAQDERYAKWRRLLNMTPSEIRAMGRRVGEATTSLSVPGLRAFMLGRKSTRRLLGMKSRPVSAWTEDDWAWATRQVSSVSKLRATPGALLQDGKPTEKLILLRAWGHEPRVRSRVAEREVLVGQRVGWRCRSCHALVTEAGVTYDHADESWMHSCGKKLIVPEADEDARRQLNRRVIDTTPGALPCLIGEASDPTPAFADLKAGKIDLTDDERAEVMRKKAVWHHGLNHKASPAVWKSIVDGKTFFVTNTHRAYNVAMTVRGAINRYHAYIKSTA